MQVWRLPDYWYWIVPLLTFSAVIFCGVKWRKYLFTAAATLSFVILSLVIAMWAISWNTRYYAAIIWIKYQPDGQVDQWNFNFASGKGGIQIALRGQTFSQTSNNAKEFGPRSLVLNTFNNQGYPILGNKASIFKSDFVQKTLGFQICWATNAMPPSNIGTYSITFPHWFAVLICLPLPAIWLKRYLRKRSRLNLGLCLKCGYDLKASTAKCPECGTPIPTRKEIAKAPDTANPAS